MADNTDNLIDKYLDQAREPQAAPSPAASSGPGRQPVPTATPSQPAPRGRAASIDIDRLIDSHLDQQKSPDFTKQQPPTEAPSAVGKAAGAVYGATLGPLVNRALEGGKQIADVLVPAPGSARQVPARYTGTSDVARSRMERPDVGQDLRDLAAGGLKIVSSPLAPLGEAARPGGEYIGRRAGKSDDQIRAELARIKSEKERLSKSDPLYKQGTEQQLDAYTAKLERQLSMGPEQRAKEAGQAAAEGAEMLGGLFLPGAGIVPKLGELVPSLRTPLTLGRAARGPLAMTPELRGATAGLASRGGEDAGLFTGQVPRDPRMVELPKSSPLRPQPAGVSETLGKAEEVLTGGARGTQREGTRSTLAAAEEMATGKRLDLGEAGRRMAAQRGMYHPEPVTSRPPSTNPAPDLSFNVQAVDEAGRPTRAFTPSPEPSAVGAAVEPVQTAEDFSRELFPSLVRRGPLGATPETPISVPDVAPTNGLMDHLRDETGHLNIGAYVDAARAAATKMRKKLPQEEFVRRVRPESPVITEVERFEAGMADKMRETFATPTSIRKGAGAVVGKPVVKTKWWDHVREMDPAEINRLEEQAVRAWEAGGRTPQAYAQAISQWPQRLRDYVAHRDAALQGEQAARRYLGLDPIPETPGPYLPRMTDAEAKDIASAGGHLGVGHGLQTTVKGAQHERVFATQLEGEAAGIPYIDRRNAFIQREMNSLKLRHTAQLIKNLESRGGLFRTKAAAEAASPTGQAFAVQGLPGNKIWYTATEPERTFIVQNLTEKGGSSIIHFQNVLLRNPNLVNPAPHAVKNMGAKYLLARGPQGLPGLARDIVEFTRNSNPALVQEFKQMMPYAEAGEPAFSTLRHATVQGPGVGRVVKEVEDALGLLNKGSSKVIFKWADPSMRYSLYKYYRTVKGMTPQEAANNAWIDLVRYGTRSDLTDFWKRIPLNMFIPWRVGTVTSLIKQATTHPVRTALTIGAIDYMREMRYRQTGRWTHMPWDYAEGPIATVIEAGRKGDLAGLSSTALITAAFGPGGEFAAKNLEDWIHGIRTGQGVNHPDFKALLKIFWGASQIGDGGKEWLAYQRDGQAKHLVNIMTGLLLGERGALEYQPKRLQSSLPQSLPGQQKDVRVQAAEAIQAQRQAQQQKRQNRHKGQTITERVGG